MEEMTRFLQAREQQGTLRTLTPLESRSGGVASVGGREYIDFSSNDYLGLSRHPALIAAAQQALQGYGVGAGASRLMSGDLTIHHQLECAIADFKGTEAALLFTSGYQANAGLLPALCSRHDVIYADALAHASLLDGAQLSRARLMRYPHNDMSRLEELLTATRDQFAHALIVTESLFSMDGDLAPLEELVTLKEQYRCRLFVDEAHATGVFGSGRVAQAGITSQVEFSMGTFSKALGGFGAYLACSALTRDYLVNAARNFIYTTALPPSIIAANLAAVHICTETPQRGTALLETASRFRAALRAQGWPNMGESQIVPVMVGENAAALQLAAAMQQRGFRVLAVRPPTVPEGQARVRFSLSVAHTPAQLQAATEAMHDCR